MQFTVGFAEGSELEVIRNASWQLGRYEGMSWGRNRLRSTNVFSTKALIGKY